jgi:hypothetical protein
MTEDFMKAERTIDFTKIEWNKINKEELQFFFNQAVEANDVILNGINNLNNKAFQLLTISIATLATLTGFILATWDKTGQKTIANTLICASIGLSVVVVLFLIAVFPRTIYIGRATPETLFSRNLYKEPLARHYADGIASYHQYICYNKKIENFRSFFLTAGMCGFFLVPIVTVILLLFVF